MYSCAVAKMFWRLLEFCCVVMNVFFSVSVVCCCYGIAIVNSTVSTVQYMVASALMWFKSINIFTDISLRLTVITFFI